MRNKSMLLQNTGVDPLILQVKRFSPIGSTEISHREASTPIAQPGTQAIPCLARLQHIKADRGAYRNNRGTIDLNGGRYYFLELTGKPQRTCLRRSKNMSKNNYLLIIVATILAIGGLVAFNLTATTIAEIRYGDWAGFEYPDGTLSYASWTENVSIEANSEPERYSGGHGLSVKRITGYGVRISRTHQLRKSIAEGTLHLFDSEEAALRFVKENGIPDEQIIVSGRKRGADTDQP